MTAEEKAKELIEKYKWINYDLDDIEGHKEAAIIAVDEILNISYFEEDKMTEEDSLYKNYWLHVKNHLNNM